MVHSDASSLEPLFKEILEALRGIVSWSWDTRFNVALGEFSANDKETVRGALQSHLTHVWDNVNVGDTSELAQWVPGHFLNVRPGQFLYTGAPLEGVWLYCAWWPWGDGQTVSIRIAPTCGVDEQTQNAGLLRDFQQWMGL